MRSTPEYVGWSDYEDEQLLKSAVEASYAAIVTLDRSLPHQQATRAYPLGIIVLDVPSEIEACPSHDDNADDNAHRLALCFKEFYHRRENLPELFRSNRARMSDYLNESDR